MLTNCNYFVDYIDSVLLDERTSLTIDTIYEFLTTFFPKVSAHVLSEQTLQMIDNTVVTLSEQVNSVDVKKMARRLSGDLRALILVYNSPEAVPPRLLLSTLKQLKLRVNGEIEKLVPKVEETETSLDSSENCDSSNDTKGKVEDGKQDSPVASTSKEESPEKLSDDKESDSETQNSCEEKKEKARTPIENLRLLETTIDSLLVIVEEKA